MGRFTCIFLLFTSFLVSCNQNDVLSPSDQIIEGEIKSLIKISIALEKQGQLAETIKNNVRATNLLKSMSEPDHKRLYYFYRTNAKFASKINEYDLAVSFADSALHYLSLVPKSGFKRSKRNEEFSMKKFQASYLRLSGDIERSFDLTRQLLLQVDNNSSLYPQLKNQLALANLEAGNFSAAREHYQDLLKISDLDSLSRHFYLKGMARCLHFQNMGDEAVKTVAQAIEWLPSPQKYQQHYFHILRDAGRYQTTWGDPLEALKYFEAALALEMPMDTNSEFYELYRLQALTYGRLGDNLMANDSERMYVTARKNHEFMGKKVNSLFTRGWLAASEAEMKKDQELLIQNLRNRKLVVIYALLAFVVAFVLWRLISSKRAIKNEANHMASERMS